MFGARSCFHKRLSVILSTEGGSLYDVISRLAAWSHVHSGGGLRGIVVSVKGEVSVKGDRDPSRY